MQLTRFIFRPRWQSMWIRALSEAAEPDRNSAQPKPVAENTRPRRRAAQIHRVEHV